MTGLLVAEPVTAARPSMLCLSHAGGTAASFGPLTVALRDWMRLVPLERPGHGRRWGEDTAPTVADCVRDQMRQALAHLEGGSPFVVLGHSLGAWLAFELTVQLEALGRGPALLVVSGNVPPPSVAAARRIGRLPEQQFLQEVAALGGLPPRILSEPALRSVFLPGLRADFELRDAYRLSSPKRVSCPIVSMLGSRDPVTASGSGDWSCFTSAWAQIRVFEGEHFFLFDNPGVVAFLARLAETHSPLHR